MNYRIRPLAFDRTAALKRLSFRLVAVCSLAACAACGGSYAVQPRTAVDLSGRWDLDRQASSDVRLSLSEAFGKVDKRWRRVVQVIEDRNPPPEAPEAAVGPPLESAANGAGEEADTRARPQAADVSNLQWLMQQNRREMSAIVSWLSPATQLVVEQSATELVMRTNKGEGTRRFEPGETSAIFLLLGAFEVRSGWKGQSLLVDSVGKGDNKLQLSERYTLLDEGGGLEKRVVVRIPGLGKFKYRFVYRRERGAVGS